jgi:hypothetical protein
MKRKNVDKAYAKLQKAAEKFNQAITDFQSEYKPESVGLDEWIDHNNEVMSDLEVDIDSYFIDQHFKD